ncbi:hypothetical protein [Wenxinia saemankumensis]|uniref:Response regulatory domain-containing protein n=1 Tax=Wenxinia saemankumensis TaxID=1447782 RepID=A0A1M6ERD7_9RHOB|nr:hypothetical protein [Wenxinia saemankumensis]SHI88037.1 hypothetical protein SAMN05444417_2135 [Wenxinia saemankumensis]
MTDTTHSPRNLILIRDPLIADDLDTALAEMHPDHVVVRVADIDDATDALATVQDVRVVVLELGPAELSSSALQLALAAHDARVILFGPAAERAAEDSPWPVLHRPFGSDSLRRLIAPEGPPET